MTQSPKQLTIITSTDVQSLHFLLLHMLEQRGKYHQYVKHMGASLRTHTHVHAVHLMHVNSMLPVCAETN